MSWRDNLQPASFRGVPFFVDTSGHAGGGRLAEHEFPGRNRGSVENLGRKNRHYNIAAYVIGGDNYFDDRDALIEALDTIGPGTYVDPYLGQVKVEVGPYTRKETREEGGMCRFEIEFVQAGANPSPTSVDDTAGDSADESDGMQDQLGDDFDDDFDVTGIDLSVGFGLGGFGFSVSVGFAASSLFSLALEACAVLVASSGIDPGYAALQAALIVTNDPVVIADAVTTFCSGYAVAVAAGFSTPFDDTLSSRGPIAPADLSYGLASLATFGANLAAVPQDGSLDAVQMASNQAALVTLVQGSAIAAYAQLSSLTTYTSDNDAASARTTICGLIDTQATAAADAQNDATTAAWQSLSSAVAADLTTRGKQVPNVAEYLLPVPVPALFLAQRLYQDATRAGELIARNDAPFPLFMPTTIRALNA